MNQNQYYPVMNDTKWEEIRLTMYDYPSNRQWRTKDIEKGYICPWDGEWFYHFSIGGYKYIQWLEIKAETEGIRTDVLEKLKSINVPGEVFDDVIRVYGYVEIGKSVDYL
jgi:hypothetical protein